MNKEKVSFLLLQVKELSFANPFSYRREEIESEILQSLGRIRMREERFVKIDPRFDQVLHWLSLVEDYLLTDDSEEFSGKKWTSSKEALAYFCLFHELIPELDSLSKLSKTVDSKNRSVFRMVMSGIEKRRKLISEKEISLWRNPAHLFSCFYQLRRAFLYFKRIQGESATISKLRERIWESIFTHDMLSYQQWMYQVVGEFPTIILGPSGSGKEVIAGAIARSRFIPYLEKEGVFLTHPSESFFPVHLSSLSETLLESELFGHIEVPLPELFEIIKEFSELQVIREVCFWMKSEMFQNRFKLNFSGSYNRESINQLEEREKITTREKLLRQPTVI